MRRKAGVIARSMLQPLLPVEGACETNRIGPFSFSGSLMTATLTRQPKTAPGVRLWEDIASGIGRVDAEAGIIYGAKIVGFQSRNIGRTIGLDPRVFESAVDLPYSYSRQALESALPMYEGAPVRIDHPASELDVDGKRVVKQKSRSALSTSGELRNCAMREYGLYADIHLLKTHPHAGYLLEVATRMPDKIAVSHNAFGIPVLRDGRAVIDKIARVYSVDLVGDAPGTTNGLFETLETPVTKLTIKQLVESLPATAIGRALLLEMAPEMYSGKKVSEMQMDMPAAEGDMGGAFKPTAEAQVGDALRMVVMAIVDDDTLDSAGKLTKIKLILKVQDQLNGTGGGSGSGSGAGSGTGSASDSGSAATTQENHVSKETDHKIKQLTETVATLTKERDDSKAVEHARGLLETAGRDATPVRVSAVTRERDDASRKALIESWPKKGERPLGQRPDMSAPLLESDAYSQAENPKAFARRINSR